MQATACNHRVSFRENTKNHNSNILYLFVLHKFITILYHLWQRKTEKANFLSNLCKVTNLATKTALRRRKTRVVGVCFARKTALPIK